MPLPLSLGSLSWRLIDVCLHGFHIRGPKTIFRHTQVEYSCSNVYIIQSSHHPTFLLNLLFLVYTVHIVYYSYKTKLILKKVENHCVTSLPLVIHVFIFVLGGDKYMYKQLEPKLDELLFNR